MRRRSAAPRSSALRVGRGTSIRNLHRRPARIFLASHDCEMAGYAKKKTSASMKFLSCRVPFIKSRNSDGKHLQFCHCRATRSLYHCAPRRFCYFAPMQINLVVARLTHKDCTDICQQHCHSCPIFHSASLRVFIASSGF